jgi:hypothetical protein
MRRGLMSEGAAKFRVIAPALALAVTTCMWGVANAREFKENAIHGGYGCLTTLLDIEGAGFQFVSNGKGAITSGEGILNFDGEVCEFTVDPAGSSYTVDSPGTGTLTIKLGSTLTDPDGDATADCTAEFGGASLHYAIVVESNGKRLDVTALDPFFTGAFFTFSDAGDFIFSGACNRQVGG